MEMNAGVEHLDQQGLIDADELAFPRLDVPRLPTDAQIIGGARAGSRPTRRVRQPSISPSPLPSATGVCRRQPPGAPLTWISKSSDGNWITSRPADTGPQRHDHLPGRPQAADGHAEPHVHDVRPAFVEVNGRLVAGQGGRPAIDLDLLEGNFSERQYATGVHPSTK